MFNCGDGIDIHSAPPKKYSFNISSPVYLSATISISGKVISPIISGSFTGRKTLGYATLYSGVPAYTKQAGEFADKVTELPQKGIEFGKDILKIGDTN